MLNSINGQNIPSHNPEVRLLFKAAPGYRIVGSDYSGQEVRLAAYLSQDPVLLKSYAEDKDVYASIASSMFGLPYEDCLEFYKEFSVVETDGKRVVAGSGKDYEYAVENNCVEVPNCYLIKTDCGEKEVSLLTIGTKLITDEGMVEITDIVSSGELPSDKVLLKLAKIKC